MTTQEKSIQLKELLGLLGLLCAAVAIRLIDISQPFIDGWSWRQSDNAMIADNFYRYGFNFFYPQMSYTGNTPGYVGSEFPLLTFAAALLYVPFGVQEWIGRSLCVLFFAGSMPFFYLLVKKLTNQRTAFIALGIYALTPLSIYTSRSFMIDMPMLSFSIAALYLFAEWLERPGPKLFIAAGLTTALAILVKLPAIIIGLPLLYMAWETHGKRLLMRRELWGFAAISLIPPLLWYYHSYLVSTSSFPMSLFWQPSALTHSVEPASYLMILHRVGISGLTLIVSVAMLAGMVMRWPAKFGYVFHWWLLAIILFIVFAATGNARHPWYQLPVVPVAAAFAGRACDAALRRLREFTASKMIPGFASVLFFAALSYLAYVHTQPLYKPWQITAWKAGRDLDRIAPSDALVLVATDLCDPTPLYYTRRRGWHFLESDEWCRGTPQNSQQAIENLEKLRRRGASYLVFDVYTKRWLQEFKTLGEHLDSHYRRVRQTDDYIIFDIHSGASRADSSSAIPVKGIAPASRQMRAGTEGFQERRS